ncbi:GGDEF domain-containing response regulator [Spongiibacter marinus]|uniref:GGDEF domain-containing response regulator n=1 Tax=Spongiibacter marinus TaxID=354246 RepID=UPI0003FDF45C|nr:diguanylate cyclase [Spongiibacter marinus]MBM7421895.1 diguanylate cyclase (GGDEF)-like protein [Spongiibacter marinus]
MPNVLIVEDNRSLASMARAIIEDIPGFQACVAASGAEAKQLIRDTKTPFTAALVDLNLPDAPNGEVVPVVQSFDIPVVVLTGFFGDELRNRMIELGVVDYVLKKNISAYDYASRLVERIHRNRSTQVLVVDDSPSAAAMLKRYLEIQCLNVLVCHNGQEALDCIREQPNIRLVLTDYNMPVLDGFDFIQQVRAKYAKDQLAIIGLSSSNDARLSARFLKSGANDFISKPFGYEELLCRVNQNLEYMDRIDEIRDAANRDYLTKLYNRRYFFSEAQLRHQQAQFQELPLSVAMLDIDHFKHINDSLGHDAGDTALKHLAALLQSAFPDDLIARFGGEEFCILSEQNAEHTFDRLDDFRRKLANNPVKENGYDITLSVSGGLSNGQDDSLDTLIKMADSKLYQAKESGRNRIVV